MDIQNHIEAAVRLIPLYGRRATVRGFALVDVDDYEAVTRYWWWLNGYGYAEARNDDKRRVLMHRVVLGLTHGDGLVVDHINWSRLDNRRSNLRLVTAAENSRHQPKRGGELTTEQQRAAWRERKRRQRDRERLELSSTASHVTPLPASRIDL